MNEVMSESGPQDISREDYGGEILVRQELMMEKEYKPSKNEILRDYEINLRFLSGRGMIISVGCKQIAFEDTNKGMEELAKYIDNPYEERKKWNKIFDER